MNSKRVCRDEQIKLIMECRQSGLSDYQWCKREGIHPGNFYNWVSKLRKAGYTFPDSECKNAGTPVKQEVVKVNLPGQEPIVPSIVEQNTGIPVLSASCVAAEIQLGSITVRIFNGAQPSVIQNTLKCIGGLGHAW